MVRFGVSQQMQLDVCGSVVQGGVFGVDDKCAGASVQVVVDSKR